MSVTSPETAQDDSQSLRVAAVGGSMWSAAYRWSARLVSFLTFAVLGRLLDPSEFGVVAIASAVAGYLSILTDFGLHRFVVHMEEMDERQRSTVLWLATGLGVAVGLLQVAAAPAVAGWLHEPSVTLVLQVMAISYPLSALYGVMSGFQKRRLRFRLLAVRGMVAVVVSAGVAIVLAVLGFGVWALVGQVVSYSAVSLLVLWVDDPWVPRLLWSRETFGRAVRYGRPALGAAFMNSVGSQSDTLVIGHRLGTEALGYYSVATRLVQVVLDTMVSIVLTVAFPVLARARDDRVLLAAAYRRAVTQSVLLSAPAIAVVVGLMPDLIDLLFGPKWTAVAGVASLLAISRVLLVPAWFDSALLYAVGRVRIEMWLSVLGAVTVLLAAVLGSSWGLTGVAIGMLVRSLLMWPLLMVVSCRITRQPITPVMVKVVSIWVAAGLAGGLAALTGHFLASPVAAIGLGGCVAAIAFLGAALLLARATSSASAAGLARGQRSAIRLSAD